MSKYACCVLTTQPLPWLSCQIQHGDDAISCSVHMIASPAYSSSVVCPPHTYTGTHALTHLSLLSCDVTRAAELIPTHSLAILPWKGKRCSVWEVVIVARGDLLFSLHYSHLPVALVVCRIWQSPSSLYRIRWGNIIHWTHTQKKCFSSHRGWCWLEDWTFVSERCVVLGQSLCYGSVSGLRAWLAATAWHVKLSCFT